MILGNRVNPGDGSLFLFHIDIGNVMANQCFFSRFSIYDNISRDRGLTESSVDREELPSSHEISIELLAPSRKFRLHVT
jgi:hypothetical protein